jgi:hypothetical protein
MWCAGLEVTTASSKHPGACNDLPSYPACRCDYDGAFPQQIERIDFQNPLTEATVTDPRISFCLAQLLLDRGPAGVAAGGEAPPAVEAGSAEATPAGLTAGQAGAASAAGEGGGGQEAAAAEEPAAGGGPPQREGP